MSTVLYDHIKAKQDLSKHNCLEPHKNTTKRDLTLAFMLINQCGVDYE